MEYLKSVLSELKKNHFYLVFVHIVMVGNIFVNRNLSRAQIRGQFSNRIKRVDTVFNHDRDSLVSFQTATEIFEHYFSEEQGFKSEHLQ